MFHIPVQPEVRERGAALRLAGPSRLLAVHSLARSAAQGAQVAALGAAQSDFPSWLFPDVTLPHALQHMYLVLCSDGVSDVLSPTEVLSVLQKWTKAHTVRGWRRVPQRRAQ